MKRNKKTRNSKTRNNATATTSNGKLAKRAKPSRRANKTAAKNTSTNPSYRYRRATYRTKAALIMAYLDAHEVATGQVPPPSVADFVRDTGVQAGHGMYGARLHEYCHAARTDSDGCYTIDRRALRAGKDGRVFQVANAPEAAPAQGPAKGASA